MAYGAHPSMIPPLGALVADSVGSMVGVARNLSMPEGCEADISGGFFSSGTS